MLKLASNLDGRIIAEMTELTLGQLGETLKERFGENLELYTPQAYVSDAIQETDLTTFSGPAGAGKNYLAARSGVPEVLKESTRALRANEVQGVSYNSRCGELDVVREEILNRSWLQVKFGPNKKDVYGSKPDGYPKGSAVVDTIAQQALEYRDNHEDGLMPFKSLRGIYVISPDFSTLVDRLDGRPDIDGRKMDSTEKTKRFKEAYDSLEIGLSDSWFECVVNEDEGKTALEMIKKVIDRQDRDERLNRIARNAMYAIRLEIARQIGLPTSFGVYSSRKYRQNLIANSASD
jgi:guanylate kinase